MELFPISTNMFAAFGEEVMEEGNSNKLWAHEGCPVLHILVLVLILVGLLGAAIASDGHIIKWKVKTRPCSDTSDTLITSKQNHQSRDKKRRKREPIFLDIMPTKWTVLLVLVACSLCVSAGTELCTLTSGSFTGSTSESCNSL